MTSSSMKQKIDWLLKWLIVKHCFQISSKTTQHHLVNYIKSKWTNYKRICRPTYWQLKIIFSSILWVILLKWRHIGNLCLAWFLMLNCNGGMASYEIDYNSKTKWQHVPEMLIRLLYRPPDRSIIEVEPCPNTPVTSRWEGNDGLVFG